MQSARIVQIGVVLAYVIAVPAVAAGQSPDPQVLRQEIAQLRAEFETLRQQYDARLSALEAQLAPLPAETARPVDATPPVETTPLVETTPPVETPVETHRPSRPCRRRSSQRRLLPARLAARSSTRTCPSSATSWAPPVRIR